MIKNDLVILAVDDNLFNLKLLRSILKKSINAKEIIEVENGIDAMDVLKSRDDLDLILLDVFMPVMGGIELLKILQNEPNIQHVPTIVLSTDETQKSEVLTLGADDFLMKPIKKDDLIKKIYKLLDN